MRLKILIGLVVLLMIVSTTILLLNLYEFIKTDTIIISQAVRARAGEPISIEVNVNKYDRVYLILSANTTISEVYVEPKNMLIRLPLDVEGFEHDISYPIILQRGFFYIANSTGSARITMIPRHQIPYAIKTAEGRVSADVLIDDKEKDFIVLDLKVEKFAENGFSQLLLVYPYGERAEPDFQVEGTIKLIKGRVAYVNFILMTDLYWYAFRVAPETAKEGNVIRFNVNAGSRELFGRDGEFLGRKVLFVAFGIGFCKGQWSANETPLAELGIGNLHIHNRGEKHYVNARVLSEYDLKPRIYILRKFTPTYTHILLTAALASEVLALAYLSSRRLKHDEENESFFNHGR